MVKSFPVTAFLDKMAPCSMSETVLRVAQKDASYTVVYLQSILENVRQHLIEYFRRKYSRILSTFCHLSSILEWCMC